MDKVAFSHLLTIYRACRFATGDKATIFVKDGSVKESLEIALAYENLDDSGLAIDDENIDIEIGATINLRVTDPKIALGHLARNFGTFLQRRKVKFSEPKNYYLIDESFAKSDSAPPFNVSRYRKVLELIALLCESAAYLDQDRGELIFIRDGKYSVPLDYSAGELTSIDENSLDKILKMFSSTDDAHRVPKLAILAESSLSLMEGVAPGRRFRALLTELAQLSDKFSDGYKIYLANFSYDKVRDELQAWKVDYTGKIHKAFSDIQNQLLSIPVATVVVATQLKPVKAGETAFLLANLAVIIGSWIFSILFFLLCRNQTQTLQVLKAEIIRQENKMRTNYETMLVLFNEVVQSLHKRVADQERILFWVKIFLGVGLLIAHWFAWQLTKPFFLS